MLHALEALSRRLVRQGRWAEAVEAAMAAVTSEPLRESAQRTLIDAYLAGGNWVEARRAFDAYRALLRRELETEPPADLTVLFSVSRARGHGFAGRTRLTPAFPYLQLAGEPGQGGPAPQRDPQHEAQAVDVVAGMIEAPPDLVEMPPRDQGPGVQPLEVSRRRVAGVVDDAGHLGIQVGDPAGQVLRLAEQPGEALLGELRAALVPGYPLFDDLGAVVPDIGVEVVLPAGAAAELRFAPFPAAV